MKRRSKYSTGGGRDKSRPPAAPENAKPAPAVDEGPYAGKPLDGSQYLDVIEEQKYAEQRPSQEEQEPHRDKPPGLR